MLKPVLLEKEKAEAALKVCAPCLIWHSPPMPIQSPYLRSPTGPLPPDHGCRGPTLPAPVPA